MTKRKVHKRYLRLEISVPPEVDSALESLATMSGVSKATVAREALVTGLAPYDLIPAHVVAAMPTTLSAGPRSTAHKKEKN
ncbi:MULTISPECIES: CopG family transcriptional regulator [unclassified Microbacterium]|uniref:ribbon-helix-helix domain-containing protein n=1 Tax=unclassified Microbacterium TaxID=2609290 RepID=UPI0030191C75